MSHNDIYLIGISRGAGFVFGSGRYGPLPPTSEHRLRRGFGRALGHIGEALTILGGRLARPALPKAHPEWLD